MDNKLNLNDMTRGIRNNNPLNIRRSKDKWQGQLTSTPSPVGEGRGEASLTDGRLCSGSTDSKQASVCTRYDAEFCQFESQAYGWRAAFVLLTRTYYHTYRLYTIRAIVTKWAPPNENATAAYIRSVALQTGIDPDEPLGIPSEKPARWMMLAWAMAIQECGEQGLSIFQMLQGWQMARD